MGVSKDSNKRSSQGIKAPIPVPGSWATRVASNRYAPSDTSDETESMQGLHDRLCALATALETTWLEQKEHLKAVEQILNRFAKQKVPPSQPALDYLRVVAAPILVECYFLPSDIAVRRFTLLPIQLVTAILGSLGCAIPLLRANLLAFIGAPNKGSLAVSESASEAYTAQTGGQRAHAIEVLASTSQGTLAIGQTVGDILSFAASEFDIALQRLTGPTQGMGSAELASVRDECTQAVRLVFLCMSKFAGPGIGDTAAATLTRIYELCWNLISCDIAALNSRQVAAMTLVQLV
ncbi:hypothetical protein GGI10_006430, partial [Coemansia sp. RSA 2530]